MIVISIVISCVVLVRKLTWLKHNWFHFSYLHQLHVFRFSAVQIANFYCSVHHLGQSKSMLLRWLKVIIGNKSSNNPWRRMRMTRNDMELTMEIKDEQLMCDFLFLFMIIDYQKQNCIFFVERRQKMVCDSIC